MLEDENRNCNCMFNNMNNNMNGVTGWGSKDQIRK